MHTIVIVEDHSLISAGLRFFLEQHARFKIVGDVSRGDQAEAAVAQLDPDLVILDIALPAKSGLDILENLKARGGRAKVLILSGQAHGVDFQRAIDLGADGIASKSEPPEVILQALDTILPGGRFISDAVRTLTESVADDRRISLTGRERQVLAQMAEGLSNAQIAKKLGVEAPTVKKHRENLMRKLKVRTAVEASRMAYQLGIAALTPKH